MLNEHAHLRIDGQNRLTADDFAIFDGDFDRFACAKRCKEYHTDQSTSCSTNDHLHDASPARVRYGPKRKDELRTLFQHDANSQLLMLSAFSRESKMVVAMVGASTSSAH